MVNYLYIFYDSWDFKFAGQFCKIQQHIGVAGCLHTDSWNFAFYFVCKVKEHDRSENIPDSVDYLQTKPKLLEENPMLSKVQWKKDSLAKHMKSPLKPGRRRKKLTLKTPDEKKTKEQWNKQAISIPSN